MFKEEQNSHQQWLKKFLQLSAQILIPILGDQQGEFQGIYILYSHYTKVGIFSWIFILIRLIKGVFNMLLFILLIYDAILLENITDCFPPFCS